MLQRISNRMDVWKVHFSFLPPRTLAGVPCGDAQSHFSPLPGLEDSVLWWFGDLGTWDLTENMCSGGWDMCTLTLSCINQGFCESPLMYNILSSPDQNPEGKPSPAWGLIDNLFSPFEVPVIHSVLFALSWVMWMVWMYSPALCSVALGIFGPGSLWNCTSVPWGTVLWPGSWK